MKKTRFAIMGAAGYVAPRHMAAIRDVGGELVAAYDVNDSVGVLDRYFDECLFTTYEDEFYKMCDSEGVDIISICTPNYLHSTQAAHALDWGHDVLCEKPVCISPLQLDTLETVRKRTGRNLYAVLQLRHDPELDWLHDHVEERGGRYQVEVEYITRRGPWYGKSWKADAQRSGGLLMNIGVHFFDALLYIFGPCQEATAHHDSPSMAEGTMTLQRADVRWKLSLDKDDLPGNEPTHRVFKVDGHFDGPGGQFEVSSMFNDLHRVVYAEALQGRGFGLEDCRAAIELVHGLSQRDENGRVYYAGRRS